MKLTTWIHLDRRSKTPIERQIVEAMVAAIKQELFLALDLLPTESLLSEQLQVPLTLVHKAYEQLQLQQHIFRKQGQWLIKPNTLHTNALPRPFGRRISTTSETLPLTVTTLEDKILVPSANLLLRFPMLKQSVLQHVVKHYATEGRLVAISTTDYVLPLGTLRQEERVLEARVQPTDAYIRQIDIITPNAKQKKEFDSSPTLLLKGTYSFHRGEHTLLEIGEVYTTLIYAYAMELSANQKDFIF